MKMNLLGLSIKKVELLSIKPVLNILLRKKITEVLYDHPGSDLQFQRIWDEVQRQYLPKGYDI
jgi:hypothetical protein